MAEPSLAPARVSWSWTDGPQETRERLNRFFSSPRRKLSPSTVVIQDWEEHPEGCILAGGISDLPCAHPEPPALVPACFGNKTPSAPGAPCGRGSTPLCQPLPCRNRWWQQNGPCGAGGDTRRSPQGTMPHQPQQEFGGDLGTHLCSSAATTKPRDASSVQIEEYKVLEGRWELKGQGRSLWGHGGHCPSPAQGSRYRKAPRPWEKMIRG